MFRRIWQWLFPDPAVLWDSDAQSAMAYSKRKCLKHFPNTVNVKYRVPVEVEPSGHYGGYNYTLIQGRKIVGWVPLSSPLDSYIVRQRDRWTQREIKRHEFAHVYRYNSVGDWTHTPELRPYFILWSEPIAMFSAICHRKTRDVILRQVQVNDCMADELVIRNKGE